MYLGSSKVHSIDCWSESSHENQGSLECPPTCYVSGQGWGRGEISCWLNRQTYLGRTIHLNGDKYVLFVLSYPIKLKVQTLNCEL